MKFDARVVGFPNQLGNAKKHMPKPDYLAEVAKFKAAESRLVEKLPTQKKAITELFKKKSECISHFRCERFSFLQPLRDFACFLNGTTIEEVVEENAWTESLHLVLMGENDVLVVPFDFPMPLTVQIEGRNFPLIICSGPRLQQELENLDEYVAVEKTLGMKSFPAFVELDRQAMSKFEKAEGVGRRFWAKWGVAALQGLVQRSMKSGVPIVLDPNFGEMPIEA
ncbi:hypothetical protein OAU50_05980 [Planctomycetota bacterium]|nr:hypothetical protein [Planctomycetota bacterium]